MPKIVLALQANPGRVISHETAIVLREADLVTGDVRVLSLMLHGAAIVTLVRRQLRAGLLPFRQCQQSLIASELCMVSVLSGRRHMGNPQHADSVPGHLRKP